MRDPYGGPCESRTSFKHHLMGRITSLQGRTARYKLRNFDRETHTSANWSWSCLSTNLAVQAKSDDILWGDADRKTDFVSNDCYI